MSVFILVLRVALTLCVCVACGAPVLAQAISTCPVAKLGDASDFHIDLGGYACIHADGDRVLTLENIANGDAMSLFRPSQGGLIDFGFDDSRIWVTVHVENTEDHISTWWVTHDIPVADTLNVHLVQAEIGVTELLALRGSDPFSARPIAHRHLVSAITLPPNGAATLVIDYTSAQATEMPLFVETLPQFLNRVQAETTGIATLTALVFGMGLISTMYLYGLDERPALAYGAYVLAGVALLVHMEGYTFQYVWPNAPGFNEMALAYISLALVALGLFFVDRFTHARGHFPRLHQATVALIFVLCMLAVLAAPMIDMIWFKNTVLLAVCLGMGLQVLLACAAMARGQSGARLLVLGFGALGATITFGAVGYLTEGLFKQELAGSAIRLGFLLEAIAFSFAIALRIRASRRERDYALQEQVRLSEERLNLSEALRQAEDDRRNAAKAAVRSQEALASTAHDLRQPLASLQMALASGPAAQDRVSHSLKYLEEIVRFGLEEHAMPLGTGDANPPSRNATEPFHANLVLDNINAMFGEEAEGKNVAFRVLPCSAQLVSNPLALMRCVGNLVSNALQHAQASRVIVGCRRTPCGSVRFEVHDNGQGMSDHDLTQNLARGRKGVGSDGHGLGLAIVTDIASENGLKVAIRSIPKRGTCACIEVPFAPVTPTINLRERSAE